MTADMPATAMREAKGIHSESRVLHMLARGTVFLVAVGAAVLSFDALTALAVASGIHEALAWIWAVVIDGFILVATIAAFALNKRSRMNRIYAWLCLALFTVFSIIGNGWHAAILATPDLEAPLPLWMAITVTGIPPIALFLAIHLLFIMLSPTDKQEEEIRRAVLAAEREVKKKAREAELAARRKPALQAAVPGVVRQAVEPFPSTPPQTPQSLSQASGVAPVPTTPVSATNAPKEPTAPPAPPSTPSGAKADDATLPDTPWLADFGLTPGEPVLDRPAAKDFLERLEAEGLSLPSQARLGAIMGVGPTSGARMMKRYREGTLA